MRWIHTFQTHGCRNPSFGLVTKAKGLQRCELRGSPGVTWHTPESVGKCEGVNPHTPKTTPTLGDGVPVDSHNFITLERNLRGQNSMAYEVLYIIEKLLKCRWLKWTRIAHLDIWNTSYGQKKGRESNCQFNSRPKKVRNRLDLLDCKQRATYRWKALDESYNFALDCTSIWGLVAKLWGSKVARVPVGAISGLPLESPRREKPFGCGPCGEVQSIL